MNKVMEGYTGVKFNHICKGDFPRQDFEKYGRPITFSCQFISGMGWAPKNAGNVSARLLEQDSEKYSSGIAMLITTSGLNLDKIDENDIALVSSVNMNIGNSKLELNKLRTGETLVDGVFYLLKKQNKVHEFWLYVSESYESNGYKGLSKITRFISELSRKALHKPAIESDTCMCAFLDYLVKKGVINCSVEYYGTKEPSSETLMHSLIYSLNKDVGSIIHMHSEDITQKLEGFIPTTGKKLDYGELGMALDSAVVLDGNFTSQIRDHGQISVGTLNEDIAKSLNEANGNLLWAYAVAKGNPHIPPYELLVDRTTHKKLIATNSQKNQKF